MAGEVDSNSNSINSQSVNFNDPYYISNSDHAGMQTVNLPLTTSNFLNWSRAIKMALIARNKLGFVTGSLSMPEPDSSNYQKWI